MKNSSVLKLTESAVMIALATVLSFIAIIKMPFGGSITACSMLPIIIIAYRHGISWGLLTGFAHSLIQLMAGLDSLQYATSWQAALAIVMLDYIVAFTALGLAGAFRKTGKNQPLTLCGGVLAVCALRFICHFISGCTVWAGVSIPTSDGLIYSLAYNSAYMIPETLITLIAAYWVSVSFNLKEMNLKRTVIRHKSTRIGIIEIALVCIAVAADALILFQSVQNENGFDITGISNANWPVMLIVTAAAVLIAAAVYFIRRHMGKKTA